jgi:hypothetical protein
LRNWRAWRATQRFAGLGQVVAGLNQGGLRARERGDRGDIGGGFDVGEAFVEALLVLLGALGGGDGHIKRAPLVVVYRALGGLDGEQQGAVAPISYV